MKSYGQYCLIARAAEVFAERWTPIIVRNLHLGCQTFTAIHQGAPGIPKSLLAARLEISNAATADEHVGSHPGVERVAVLDVGVVDEAVELDPRHRVQGTHGAVA